jgi:hypothetical protein
VPSLNKRQGALVVDKLACPAVDFGGGDSIASHFINSNVPSIPSRKIHYEIATLAIIQLGVWKVMGHKF